MTARRVAAPAPAGQLLEQAMEDVDLADVAAVALCAQVDPELFFPPVGGRSRPAKQLCALCPAREACLRWAMAHPVEGVWGGTTAVERARLARNAGRPYPAASSPLAGPHGICGTDAAKRRHYRAGESCKTCGVNQ